MTVVPLVVCAVTVTEKGAGVVADAGALTASLVAGLGTVALAVTLLVQVVPSLAVIVHV